MIKPIGVRTVSLSVCHRFVYPLILLLLTQSSWAATIHVNNVTGKDTHTGQSLDQSVKTLQMAVKLLQSGDTLHIANTGQAYRESLIIDRDLGTPDMPLVIEGNGVVLSGLVKLDPAKWTEHSDGVYAYPIQPMPSNWAPVLINGSQVIPIAGDEASMIEGQCVWQKQRLLYKPVTGNTPATLPLEASLIDSGVAIVNSSYITVRNLISERHANDGFNIHGNARGIIFENIVGRYNGDDGCSIHEDGQLLVRNAWFHHNQFGIEDVNASTSNYQAVLVEHNHVGIHFTGGYHQLTDSILRNNTTDQLQVGRGFPSGYLGKDNTPFVYDGFCLAKNLQISGGANGVLVVNRGKVALANALISQSKIGILLLHGATLELRSSIIQNCTTSEVRTIESHFLGDYNLYYPGHLDVDHKRGISMDAFQTITKADAHSRIEQPSFSADAPLISNQPFSPSTKVPGLTHVYPLPLSKSDAP
ncbi:MAG TPA: hypothetical protein DCM28_07200 [Phycisphaerales bacterium]|nr:hypothetical protein [Phycisphaerales bacterium]|tara:strand:+ start:65943 stop:67364 length:1422 start_codon:yes stop_codon:yes gene_type:complete